MEVGSAFDLNIEEFYKNTEKKIIFPIEENYIYKERMFFNTGRSAIEYLFRYQLDVKEGQIILLPNFLCSSITDALKRANIKYEFYDILSDFQININDLNMKINKYKSNIIFYINYFGFFQSDEVISFLKYLKKDKDCIIIEDNTQALFTRSNKNQIAIGNYIIASIRKWFPIPDGAVLYSQEDIKKVKIDNGYNEYMTKYLIVQLMKNEYLKNKRLDKEKYLHLLKESTDALFSDYKIRNITEVSYKLIQNYDFKLLCQKRRENYKYLYKKLLHIKHLKIPFELVDENVVPFGFVILLKRRDDFLNYCITKNIYCNIHWRDTENELSNYIITIPCDQRYNNEDMDYIMDVIEKFFEKGKS